MQHSSTILRDHGKPRQPFSYLIPGLRAFHQISDCLDQVVLRSPDLRRGIALPQSDGAIIQAFKIHSNTQRRTEFVVPSIFPTNGDVGDVDAVGNAHLTETGGQLLGHASQICPV